MKNSAVFFSFIQGGFECTAALNRQRRLQLLFETQHDQRCLEDYQLLQELGILTVREGLNWSEIDQGKSTYCFDRFIPIMEAGQKLGMQQIWDLNHFDYPSSLDVFSPEFIERFTFYAVAAVQKLRSFTSQTLFIVPINEISFSAWIGADKGWWAPFKRGRKNGFRLKQQLVRASLAAMDAVWQVDADVRFIQVDPFMRRVAKNPANAKAKRLVNEFNQVIRYEAWDMLAGKTCPELGGHPRYLDIIGLNYYIHNQEWVISDQQRIHYQQIDWQSPDRVSFAQMIQEVSQRYQRPILISETGSFGEQRQGWWQRVLQEVEEGLQKKLPILGVCGYPVLDRPEQAGFLVPQSGWWDFAPEDPSLRRIPHPATLSAIRQGVSRLDHLV